MQLDFNKDFGANHVLYLCIHNRFGRGIQFSASQSETSESVPQQQVGVQGDSDLTLGAYSSGNTVEVSSLDPQVIQDTALETANADDNVAGVATAALQSQNSTASTAINAEKDTAENAEADVTAASVSDESNALGFAQNITTENYNALENNTSEAFGTIDALVAEQASGSQQSLLDAENADAYVAAQTIGSQYEPINEAAPADSFSGNSGDGGTGLSTTDLVTIGSVVTIGLAIFAYIHSDGTSS